MLCNNLKKGPRKSQIAIEYTYRVREAAPNTWVFWIHASNATRFKQGYREIASVAEIPGRDNPNIDILQLVNRWLSDEKNSDWLMVLDNADDNNVFFEPLGEGENMSLAHYLPQTANGSILITSRNKTAAHNLVGSYGNVISVDPMSPGDALALLRTRIKVDQSLENEAKALVKALEHIPLAITQAGAYIANRSPRITLSSYLDLFHRSESNQEHLLKYDDFKDLRRDESIRHPVITTWQISFDQIRHTSSMATDLLALMSMFDRQGIPEDLINQNMNQLDFEDAVTPLISFSLIRAEIRGQSFEMHRLVQLSIRQWLKLHGQLDRWVKESRNVMEKAFPSGDYENWATCQMLFPHFKEMIKFTLITDDADQVNEAAVAKRCGWYLFLTGSYDEAEGMYRRALIAREKVLGAEHPDTLASVNNLGSVLASQGKYKEAEGIHQRALEGYKKVLGAEHPDTLASVDNLGSVLASQGKYKEAEGIHQRALEGYKKVLGAEHPDTLISVNNLASVLRSQGKYEEAEAIQSGH
jgi:tetratricopeptide (TPR) repeat protein